MVIKYACFFFFFKSCTYSSFDLESVPFDDLVTGGGGLGHMFPGSQFLIQGSKTMVHTDLQTNKEAIQKRQTIYVYKKTTQSGVTADHMSEVLKGPNYCERFYLMGFKRRRSLVTKAPV